MLKITLSVLTLMSITACSPKFDWRDSRDGVSPYTVLMPGKPSVMSRDIHIGEQSATMRMTATQIDGLKFAVGAARMSDPKVATASITFIKDALVQNMAGHITEDKNTVATVNGLVTISDEFDASAPARRMVARVVARDSWVFQVVVVGPEKEVNSEVVETFLTSFKPD